MKRERIFLEVFNDFVRFSTVCSVKVAFVQIFHFIYQFLYFLNYFLLVNCRNSGFLMGKLVLLTALSSGLEIVPGSQLREFTDLALVYCW